MEAILATPPKRYYYYKFLKLNLEKIVYGNSLKPHKNWNCKVLLGLIMTTITQCNFLLVLLPRIHQ